MASNDPLIGKQIGNYHILAEVNSGSFGSVYQGKHIIFEDDSVVAIKLLHATFSLQQERTEFIKEAQFLKRLQHPHILHILDAGFHAGTPYLITEYAPGGSLRDRFNKSNDKPFPIDEAIEILIQIGQALHYAHEQNIVHRDLKPENILFNQTGEALLADFGIAIVLDSIRTRAVGVGGTPPYMAPEQFEGLASPKSDQYSLGCIAYELLTGHRLFTLPNPSMEAYWYHHAKVEPEPLITYNPQLPIHLEQAILTALAKDRTKRYIDVRAFNAALLKSKKDWIEEISPSTIPPEIVSVKAEAEEAAVETPQISSLPSPQIPTTQLVSVLQTEEKQQAQTPPAQITSHRFLWPARRVSLLASLVAVIILGSVSLFFFSPGKDSGLNAQKSTASVTSRIMLNAGDVTNTADAETIGTLIARSDSSATASAATATALIATANVQNPDPYPQGGTKLVIFDQLKNNSEGNQWQSDASNCTFANGGYTVNATDQGPFATICTSGIIGTFPSLTIEVQMSIIEGDCGGIVLQASLEFQVCQNGSYSLYECSPGCATPIALATGTSSIIQQGLNKHNLLGINVQANGLTLYINRQQIKYVQFQSGGGDVEFDADTTTSLSTNVVFTNLKVWI